MTDTDALPCAVPVEEQLERIPADAVLQWVEPDGLKAWHHVPIGRLAHEAAAAIREQAQEIARLIKLRDDWCNEYTKVRDEFAAFKESLGKVQ